MSYAKMLADLLPQVDTIYEKWTMDSHKLLESLPPDVKISCKKGCGACCYFPVVPATLGEAFVLFNHLLAGGYTVQGLQAMFGNYADRYFAVAHELGALPFDALRVKKFVKAALPCPLFEKTPSSADVYSGHCSAFSVRPLICDYFHSTDSPSRCERREPHGAVSSVVNRGVQALDELRKFERKTYGWSVLAHLPLLLGVLCTRSGIELITTLRTTVRATEEEQLVFEFEIFTQMLEILGYTVRENDLHALGLAQQELNR